MSVRVGLARVTTPLAIALVAGLFAICHPYPGIQGDASIYMMRVLADLDPARLGRDLMVVDDGQMRFSLFPLLLRPLVAGLGASMAALLVAALGSAAWFGGLSLLAHRLAPARVAWTMVAMVSVLPVSYGDLDFSFAETAATPRPFAEAAVLAALAAILAGRPLLATMALGVALLIHPLMALAGLGVAAILVLWRLPSRARVAALAFIGFAAIGAGVLGCLGTPLFDRLTIGMDPAWFDLVVTRVPHLFPTLWTSAAFAPLLAQAATITVAAHHAPLTQRRLYIATGVVGATGLAAAALLADTLHVVLFVQLQTWRGTWLVAVIGGCALAYCTAMLWRGGPLARVVLALLGLAWFFQPTPLLTLAVAGLALLLEFGSVGRSLRLEHRHVVSVYALVTIATVYWAGGPMIGYLAYLRALPLGQTPSLTDPLRNNLQTLPLVLVIAAWLVAPQRCGGRPITVIGLAIACLAFAAANLLGWDQRGAPHAYLETLQEPPGLAALAVGRDREVFWVGDESDAWFALERPQFFSPQQGVSTVFSRPLAMEWARRARLLVGLGLEPRDVFRPWKRLSDDERLHVTQPAVDTLCARPDAPGLVLFPLGEGQLPLRDMIVWTLPAPLFKVEKFASDETRRIDAFGIVPCAPRDGSALPR